MTLIPGFIRDDDSTAAGAANFATFRGIKGNRQYYSSNRGVRSITMNPFSAREFGYGAVVNLHLVLLLLVLLDRIMQILMLLMTVLMLVTLLLVAGDSMVMVITTPSVCSPLLNVRYYGNY